MTFTSRTTRRTAATFVVRILGTEGGDWHGQIDHIQSGAILRFKHGIEAIRFIDQQLFQTPHKGRHTEPRSQSSEGA